jgi:predicted nucleic-acid-binding protein
MEVGLDTSVVLRLLIGMPADQAEKASAFLDELFAAGDQAVVSDLVISEVYFALQHHYAVPKASALEALAALLQSGEIVSTGAAAAVLATGRLATARPGFVDRLIHAEYERHCEAMVTFEKKASRLPGTRVLG